MKVLIHIFNIIIIFSNTIHSQSSVTQKTDNIFSNWEKDAPGCMVAVFKNGKTIYEKEFGLANMEHNIPIRSNTVFQIGSMSKQFTAACILLLVQEGKINMDDPLSKYFPKFPAYAKQINISHLLYLSLIHI